MKLEKFGKIKINKNFGNLEIWKSGINFKNEN